MIRITRWLKRISMASAIAISLLAVATVITNRTGNPELFPPHPHQPSVTVTLVDSGYHTGLVLRRDDLWQAASSGNNRVLQHVLTRFAAYPWLEIGWGEAAFYQSAPTVTRFDVTLAAKALFGGSQGSVLHIVGLKAAPEDMFSRSSLVTLNLSTQGASSLVARLGDSFERTDEALPVVIGPGLYGPSLFYEAKGSFHLLNVCNHWVSHLLDAAGVPTSPVLSLLPAGLMLDLRWRSGAKVLAQPAALP